MLGATMAVVGVVGLVGVVGVVVPFCPTYFEQLVKNKKDKIAVKYFENVIVLSFAFINYDEQLDSNLQEMYPLYLLCILKHQQKWYNF